MRLNTPHILKVSPVDFEAGAVRFCVVWLMAFFFAWWQNTAVITRLTAEPVNGTNYVAGSYMEVIGVKEEAIDAVAAATYNITNVSSPPTASELSTNLGAPSTANRGKLWLLDDGGADTSVYLVASNGTSWWYAATTKAT